MAYSNARRTLASTITRALSSSSGIGSRGRTRFAFALSATKQTLPIPHSFPVRMKSSGSGYSPLNDPSPNWSNRPPKETILLDGCDYEHWLIVMEFPDNPKPSEDEMVNSYVTTLTQVLGSEEEARKKIYSVSTTTYTGFGALVSEELSYKIKGLTFTNHGEIGLICNLTNTYCLVGSGGSENFYSSIEAELDVIPIIKTSIGGTSSVGRYCYWKQKWASLAPYNHTRRRSLPDKVVVALIEEGLTAYGLFCNDHVALAHADLHLEFKELITDVLGAEVFTPEDSYSFFSGTYCALSNIGGLIHPSASRKVLDELSAALEVPLVPGTVNRGSVAINPSMTVNDWTAFCGSSTTKAELCVIDRVFKLREP